MKGIQILAMAVAALSLAGCGKQVADAVMAANGVQLNKDGSGTMTLGDNKGNFAMGDDIRIPDGFPKDVPVYTGAKIKTALTVGASLQIGLQTADKAAKVADFYKSSLTAAGWKIEADLSSQDSLSLMLSKAGQQLQIIAGPSSSGTDVLLTATKGQ